MLVKDIRHSRDGLELSNVYVKVTIFEKNIDCIINKIVF